MIAQFTISALTSVLLFLTLAASPLLDLPVQALALLGLGPGGLLLWRSLSLRRLRAAPPSAQGGDEVDRLLRALQDSREAEAALRQEAEAARRSAEEAQARAEAMRQRLAEWRQRVENGRGRRMHNASATLDAAVRHLEEAAEALLRETAATASGAERQKELAAEASTAMEQMSAAVTAIAGSSVDASERAEAARRKARQGAGVVGQAVEAIEAVRGGAETLGAVMGELGTQAESIGRIMEVINDIADQTNLLALNAAIEAARAGEAGRGFAVVADEVRKLAEKTMIATKEVGEVIGSIQRGARSAQEGVDSSVSMVRQATEHAAASGRQLTEIVALADAAAEQTQSIAAATGQQAAATEQVTRAIGEVHHISSRASDSMEGSARSARQLAHQVEELARLNNVFKLLGEGSLQRLLSTLARSQELRSLEKGRIEKRLREAMGAHQSIELMYMTDPQGRQLIDNIFRKNQAAAYGSTGLGERWDARPWFVGAMTDKELFISESYVSQASGRTCITVSLPVESERGEILGVLAADVELEG